MASSSGQETVIGQKYRIGRKIGSGSFGEICSGTVLSSSQEVAIKFEKKSARCPQLRHEFKVYRELQGWAGIGKVFYYGTFRECNVMVMQLLGPSLEDLFNKCGRKFSLKTTLKLADQLLQRVELLHDNHLIHRDIKPANFAVGRREDGEADVAFSIDFGLSKRYRHPHTLQHIPYRDGRTLTGTPRYASVANHRGVENSRRDDLESVGYILVYFLIGKLPWQGLKLPSNVVNGTASQKHQLILNKKSSTSLSDLCRGCPQEFQDFLQYCRDLQFDATPDYAYLRGMFKNLYDSREFARDAEWDWLDSVQQYKSSQRHKQRHSVSRSGGGGGGEKSNRAEAAVVSSAPLTTEIQPQSLQQARPAVKTAAPVEKPASIPVTFSTSLRPRTAQTDVAVQGNASIVSPPAVVIPNSNSQVTASFPRSSSDLRRNENSAANIVKAEQMTRPITSRDQVVISKGSSKNSIGKQLDADDDAKNQSRPKTAPIGVTYDPWQKRNSDAGAWAPISGALSKYNYRSNPQNGNENNVYRVNGRGERSHQSSHFVGSPLSLVRHRRGDSSSSRMQRPKSGHAGLHQYSNTRNSLSSAYAHQSRHLWGHLQQQHHRHQYQQQDTRQTTTAWSMPNGQPRPKAPTRPATAIRAPTKTAVPSTRTRHLY